MRLFEWRAILHLSFTHGCMSHHFRLRSHKEASVITSSDVDTHVRVMHMVGVVAFLSMSVALGLVFFGYPKSSRIGDQVGSPVYPEFRATAQYSKYRGWKELKCPEATGYFSLQYIDHYTSSEPRPTLCDPEGNAFTSLALNKVHSGNINESDGWKTTFGRSKTKWARSVVDLMDELWFNTIGFSSDLDSLRKPTVKRRAYAVIPPFVASENSRRFEEKDYPDVFSQEFIEDAESIAKRMKALYGGDPYLEMFHISNEANFNIQYPDGTTNPTAIWARWILKGEEQTAAKEAWVDLYEILYADDGIALFNEVYDEDFTSFEDIYDMNGDTLYDRFAEGVPEGEGTDATRMYEDYDQWNAKVGGQFHKVAYQALKAEMPNTVVTTDRHRQGIYTDAYLDAIKDYSDIFAANFYIQVENVAPSDYTIDAYAEATGLPVAITEHSYAAPETCGINDDGAHYPETLTREDRILGHFAYRDSVLRNPNVVMLGWQEYSDVKVDTEENTCGFLNFGVVNTNGDLYDEVLATGGAWWDNYDDVRWSVDPIPGALPGVAPLKPVGGIVTQESNAPYVTKNVASAEQQSPVIGSVATEAPGGMILSGILTTIGKQVRDGYVYEGTFGPVIQ